MRAVLFSLIGMFIGASVADDEGLIAGLAFGVLFSMLLGLKLRVSDLEGTIRTLKSETTNPKAQVSRPSVVAPEMTKPAPIVPPEPEPSLANVSSKAVAIEPVAKTVRPSAKQETVTPLPETGFEEIERKLQAAIKGFFTEGNVVAKIGAIVLFFGVAFLLKYAADRSMLSLELRLASAFISGIALVVVGWKKREAFAEYAVILQGVGFGVLYITLFAAGKFYQVAPLAISLSLMLVLVVLSGVMSIMQNAKSLAILGVTGGFLAPVLMSTGTGSHITLFSYYALLNLGIFGIAWFKSWRFLNLLGFIFTFAIGGSWGIRSYHHDYFVSTELFLLFFFSLYLVISIVFARKQSLNLKHYVDGSLVFGLPLIAFAFQAQLVEPFQYGQSVSAAVLGVLYLVLAKVFWLPEHKGVRLLAESFLALAITFLSLSVPLLLDGRWTAAVWSIEAVALLWLGLRQSHFMSRAFGLVLAIGAGLMFLEDGHFYIADSMAILNSAFMGKLLVSLAGLAIAYLYHQTQLKTYRFEKDAGVMMIIWGLLWWFSAGVAEIDRYLPSRYALHAVVVFFAVSTFIQAVMSYKLNWEKVSLSAYLFTPLMALLLVVSFIDKPSHSPFAYWGWLAWPLALVSHFLVLKRLDMPWKKSAVVTWHAIGMIVIHMLLAWLVFDWVNEFVGLVDVWSMSAMASVTALVLFTLLDKGHRLAWPIQSYPSAYYYWGALPVLAMLLAWQLLSFNEAGIPTPLPYIPVLNPLDLTQAIVFLVMAYWLHFINQQPDVPQLALPKQAVVLSGALMAFIWINVVIARSVHVFGHIPYSDHAMMQSMLFQATTSIIWTVIALSVMVLATRKALRYIWFAGAALLAVVVLKLFFIDLSGSDSMFRILSFLVVGGLMLVVGYWSPLPPKEITHSQG